MSDEMRMYIEVGFNITYLIVVWAMTILMSMRMGEVSKENQKIANLFRWAFFLLALGDSGHVGFRVAAYAMGGLEKNGLLLGIWRAGDSHHRHIFLCGHALYLEGALQRQVWSV